MSLTIQQQAEYQQRLEARLLALENGHLAILENQQLNSDLVKRLGGEIREIKTIFNGAKSAVSFISNIGRFVRWLSSILFAIMFIYGCFITIKTGHFPVIDPEKGSPE